MTEILAFFHNGFRDLISVIPPGAALAPSSTISAASLGKVPGRRSSNGLWYGYNWREATHTAEDVKEWIRWGANVGLRAARYPGLDLDVTNDELAAVIVQHAHEFLGRAPVRTGKAPKRLLMFRTKEPFGRMRLHLSRGDEHHLVEFLGDGQQYVVWGVHPSGARYAWDYDLTALKPEAVPEVSRDKAHAFMLVLKMHLEQLGYTAKLDGDGRILTERTTDQAGLVAPSIEELQAAVRAIPNSMDEFPGWDAYVRMLYAIRAAAGNDEEDGYQVFEEWAARWEGHEERYSAESEPEARRKLWRRTRGPFTLGWPWIVELARKYGYNNAAKEFDAVQDRPVENGPAPAFGSDQYLADVLVDRKKDVLRFVPAWGKWLVWDGTRWAPDGTNRALEEINRGLVEVAAEHVKSAQDKKKAEKTAVVLNSTAKAAAVRTKMQSNRALALSPDQLDQHPWLLNTPAGMVDLRTGKIEPADPDLLATKSTGVVPDFTMPTPRWNQFLDEATGSDKELQAYLQRHAGYCLTGRITEQQFMFVYGPGGNGKGVYTGALEGIMGDYAVRASMQTFIETRSDRHETELAALAGARLVIASETAAGRRWNEARIKALTGGERVTARFLYQDQFMFEPTFKLVFVGNHRPALRDVDPAIRRRIHMVPFTITPKQVDPLLPEKLRAEYPGILAWAIRGALAWQEQGGLNPPSAVRETTDEYLEEQDAVGQWLNENTEPDSQGWVSSLELFNDYGEWIRSRGGLPGSLTTFVSRVAAHGKTRRRHPNTRRQGFEGIRLIKANSLAAILMGEDDETD